MEKLHAANLTCPRAEVLKTQIYFEELFIKNTPIYKEILKILERHPRLRVVENTGAPGVPFLIKTKTEPFYQIVEMSQIDKNNTQQRFG